jgi:hypothetical protein
VAERLLVSGVMALGSGYLTFNLLKNYYYFMKYTIYFTKVKTKLMGNRLSIAPAYCLGRLCSCFTDHSDPKDQRHNATMR